jgi:hypothetical protein
MIAHKSHVTFVKHSISVLLFEIQSSLNRFIYFTKKISDINWEITISWALQAKMCSSILHSKKIWCTRSFKLTWAFTVKCIQLIIIFILFTTTVVEWTILQYVCKYKSMHADSAWRFWLRRQMQVDILWFCGYIIPLNDLWDIINFRKIKIRDSNLLGSGI